jgi:hypothetical protein
MQWIVPEGKFIKGKTGERYEYLPSPLLCRRPDEIARAFQTFYLTFLTVGKGTA